MHFKGLYLGFLQKKYNLHMFVLIHILVENSLNKLIFATILSKAYIDSLLHFSLMYFDLNIDCQVLTEILYI